jgi:hypothetical protein
MLLRIARAPFLAVRKVARVFIGGGTPPPPGPRPADTWELRHAARARRGPHAQSDAAGGCGPKADEAPAANEDTAPSRPAGPPLVISFHETPNPDASKFQFSTKEFETGGFSCANAAEAEAYPVAAALFAAEGVRSVFAVNDFVTVTKESATSWETLAPAIEAALHASMRP